MKQASSHTKIFTAMLLLLCVTQVALASFTGSADDRKSAKVSLKNLGKFSKIYTYPTLRSLSNGLQFKGSQEFDMQKIDNSLEVNSMMRLEKGNTTYVFPYKYKVKIPPMSKFKTPTSPAFR